MTGIVVFAGCFHQRPCRTFIDISVRPGAGKLRGGVIKGDLFVQCCLVITLGDHAVIQHVFQDQVTARQGVILMLQWIVEAWTVGNRAQECGL